MKNILLTLTLFIGFYGLNAQIKVVTSGDVKVGNTALNPAADLHVDNATGDADLRLSNRASSVQYSTITDQQNSLNIRKHTNNSAQIDIDPIPGPSGASAFRFFRNINTTGNVGFNVHDGSTGSVNARFSGNAQASYVASYNTAANGGDYYNRFGVGTNAPLLGTRLTVNGTAYKNSGGSNWAIPSDKKLKNNVTKFKGGLDIVNQIKVIEYDYNGKAGTVKGAHQIGVYAQDLEKIAPFMVEKATWEDVTYDDFGNKSVNGTEEILTINPSALKWILVNSIKEQQAIIEDKQMQIDNLESKLQEIIETLKDIKSDIVSGNHIIDAEVIGSDIAILDQNRPNPFNSSTVIDYFVPEKSESAELKIYDFSGKQIKSIRVDNMGKGSLNLETYDLPSGSYSYQLIVDGTSIATKTMLLQK